MTWLLKFPLLSLIIVLVTYGVFGWYVGESIATWTHSLGEQSRTWGWAVEDQAVFLGLHILAAIVIVLITSSLAAPVALITIVFGSGFKSDNRAIIAVLFWSFAVVVILRWINYFVRFLILLSAAILGKLSLQNRGMPQWQVLLILGVICLGGFSVGLLSFDYYGHILN